MSTNKLYAVNKTDTHLILKSGYLKIPKNGFKILHPSDADHPDVIHALNQDPPWLEITDKAPEASVQEAGIIFSQVGVDRGMTEAELLRSNADAKPQERKETITAIGRPEEKLDAAPETITAIGKSVEEVHALDAEAAEIDAKSKRGRKAKTEEVAAE